MKLVNFISALVFISIIGTIASITPGFTQGTQILGKNPNLATVPIQTDTAGDLYVVFSGTQAISIVGIGATSTATMSSVAPITAATVQMLPANASRKGFVFKNISTSFSGVIASHSPVVATSDIVLQPNDSYVRSFNVPTNAWFASGSGVVITIEEDQ